MSDDQSESEYSEVELSQVPAEDGMSVVPCTNQSLWITGHFGMPYSSKELESIQGSSPSHVPVDIGVIFKKLDTFIESHCDNAVFLSSDNQIYKCIGEKSKLGDHWKPIDGHPYVAKLSIEEVAGRKCSIQRSLVPENSSDVLALLDDGYWYIFRPDKDKIELKKLLANKHNHCGGYCDRRESEWGDCFIRIALFDGQVYYEEQELSGESFEDFYQSWHNKTHPDKPLEIPDGFKQSYDGLTHIAHFDDKNPRAVAATVTSAYVLCDDGVYLVSGDGYCGYPELDGGDPGEISENPAEFIHKINFFNNKKIHKLISLELTVLCWCEDGLFVWTEEYPDIDYEHVRKLGNPIRFFSDKTILDVVSYGEHYYVLTTEGMFFFFCDAIAEDVEAQIMQCSDITFSIEEHLPCVFDFYRKQLSTRKKRALPDEEDNAEAKKKQKLE